MSKNVCMSCNSNIVNKIVLTDNTKWLDEENHILKFIKNTPVKLYKQKKTDNKLVIKVNRKPGKYVLYWGSLPDTDNQILIKNDREAYGNFMNYGVCEVNSNKEIELYFNNPQPYRTKVKGKKNMETFYRHIHICYSDINNKKWLPKIYTRSVICNIDYLDLKKKIEKGTAVIINTLPCEYYAKSHLPNSYNLPDKLIKKLSTQMLYEWFFEVIKENYPKLYKLIKSKKIEIYEIPIVVYCFNSKCNSSYNAAINLQKKGFVNIKDYSPGIEGYIIQNKKFL